jgi:hypothetical protein
MHARRVAISISGNTIQVLILFGVGSSTQFYIWLSYNE